MRALEEKTALAPLRVFLVPKWPNSYLKMRQNNECCMGSVASLFLAVRAMQNSIFFAVRDMQHSQRDGAQCTRCSTELPLEKTQPRK